ncbi:helix-turn-helix transcriptional regulator [Levilactobacillus acidifarinae]|uniref:Transcriptional regulator n=1 Tax=Levilactobacillus acidifarinae DSM 19394 = JCM 15949 TaxID=1423715 RepID=A0A0R1LKA0_9LACO|nr:WYL domain-containing protein [Levilactobacillus acidifarinae]KRK96334.1 transcriptional regulator [Levilactobacillus acidifarinae DSM 19394]GEO69082.1 WYL domain-containing protein [Levilactobacillus acidifarinae]
MESNARVAEMMVRLMSGETLKQADLKKQYQISLRTCQRDIAYIRQALTEYRVGEIEERPGTYRLARQSETADLEMVLTASNILLGSRALNSPELAATLDFLSASLSPAMRAVVRKELTIPRGSYTPLSRPKPLLHRLREVADCINNNQKLTFTYLSSRATEPKPLRHHAQPVALFFENYYFYVAMLSQERGGYWLYRLDRIGEILEKEIGEKLDYAKRFSLQDHRQQTYLLDSGSLTQIRFVYRNYLQTVLDHFPGSRVLETYLDGSYLIEAYVKVDGAMFWLLSQGAHLQVVSPPSLVNRMRDELTAARDQYLNF